MNDRQLLRSIRALADRDRFRILERMAEAPISSIRELSKRLGLPCAAIQRHLDLLIEAGIVRITLDPDALRLLGETLRARYGLMKSDERSGARSGAQGAGRRNTLSHRPGARQDG